MPDESTKSKLELVTPPPDDGLSIEKPKPNSASASAPKLKPIKPALLSDAAPAVSPPMVKPDKPGFLSRFKARRPPTISGVTSPLNPLKIMRIADALDFVRLHPNEEFGWTEPLCFVRVPVKGEKQAILHLIDEELAITRLPSKQIIRHRLALATKPHDVLFLCVVPSLNLDNGSVLSG